MKRIFTLLIFLIGFNANAGLISIDLSSNNVAQGDNITVTLSASNFASFDWFDMLLNFDTTQFSLDPLSVASDLNILDPFSIFEASQVSTGIAFSYLGFDSISGDFLLASFTLKSLKAGLTDFYFSLPIGSGGFFNSASFSALDNIDMAAMVTVSASKSTTPVPEPTSIALMLLAFIGLIRIRS